MFIGNKHDCQPELEKKEILLARLFNLVASVVFNLVASVVFNLVASVVFSSRISMRKGNISVVTY